MSHDHSALIAQFTETLTQQRYNPVVVHNSCRNADYFNASESQQTSPSIPARFAARRAYCGKTVGLRLCATSTPAHTE
jgi:hypothetical protein